MNVTNPYRIQIFDKSGRPQGQELVEIVEPKRSFFSLTDQLGVAHFRLPGDEPRSLRVNGRTILRQIRHPSVVVFLEPEVCSVSALA